MSSSRARGTFVVMCALAFSLVAAIAAVHGAGLPPSSYIPVLGPLRHIPLAVGETDINRNGVLDAFDLVDGARAEVGRGTVYDASYYRGGYPPEGRGACTDVVWRAFREAGLDLKSLVEEDIRREPKEYGATGRHPDPDIDFRRVPNLFVFFKRHGLSLTVKVRPGDAANLVQWQPGDIVIFGPGLRHIGIVSDRRRLDGVPFVLHNAGPRASEGDILLSTASPVSAHFRYLFGGR